MTIYGKQVSIHALTKHENKIEKIYLTKLSILPKELLKKYGSKIKTIENKWAQKMAKGGNHQGIIVELEDIAEPTLDSIKRCDFILMLDGLTDIGNIGAIIRSAYALGVEAVVVTGIRDLKRDAIARTSSGASLDLVPVVVQNPLDLLNELKQLNFKIYGADLDGKPLKDANFEQKRVLILGSEDRGISKRVKAKIDNVYKIEMAREFDSLNVSAAAAIFIYRMSNAVK
jgi:23S rRNA (guanosine2251-2'-O)-methyltransferase